MINHDFVGRGRVIHSPRCASAGVPFRSRMNNYWMTNKARWSQPLTGAKIPR
jgi:hypothetical protein